MSTQIPKKGIHLSVVKAPSPVPLIPVEQLSPKQTEQAKRLLELGKSTGVLSGAIIGDGLWDIRPMVLERGSPQLLRLTDPAIPSTPKAWHAFQDLLHAATELGYYSDFKSDEEQGYIRRPYWRVTLSQRGEWRDDIDFLLKALFESVRTLHAAGLVHGHLSPTNVVIDGDIVHLLDVGFCTYSAAARSRRADIAPELHAGFPAGVATDIFGLSTVLGDILDKAGRSSPQFTEYLKNMSAEDPTRRPSLDWVEDKFLSGNKSSSKIQRPITSTSSEKAPTASGPLLSPNILSAIERYWFKGSIAVVIGLATFFAYDKFYNQKKHEDIPYEAYWNSGQPSLMKEVAMAAVEDKNREAQMTVVESVMKGRESTSVISPVIRIALDPRWEGELSDTDRETALKIALGSLLPREQQKFEINESTHPAIILALVASTPLRADGSQFSRVAVSTMTTLPAPFGAAFAALDTLKVKTMEHPAARGLAHIVIGDISAESVASFLFPDEEVGPPLGRLEIIKPLVETNPQLPDLIFSALNATDPVGKVLFDWFSNDSLGLWKKTSIKEKVILAMGHEVDKLSEEQLTSLLAFPRPSVRTIALAKLLAGNTDKDLQGVLKLLGGSENKLTSAQTTALLSTLRLSSDISFKYSSQLFTTNPDAGTILKILLLRNGSKSNDSFNLAASKYLTDHSADVAPTMDQFQTLITHPEPLARAFGYLKLRPGVPQEKALLEHMMTIEPNARMRIDIESRLKEWDAAE